MSSIRHQARPRLLHFDVVCLEYRPVGQALLFVPSTLLFRISSAGEIHDFIEIRNTRHSTKPLMQGPIIRARTIIVHLVFVIQQEIPYELTSSVFNKLNFLFTQRQTYC